MAGRRGTIAGAGRDGITVIEMMPIADFPGDFGWGYDGVNLFAPCHLYGTPDDLRAFVDHAHSLRSCASFSMSSTTISVRTEIICAFSPTITSPIATRTTGATRSISTGRTPGRCANFSSPTAATGSKNFISTVSVSTPPKTFTTSPNEYILGAIGRGRAQAAGERSIIMVAENEPQETKLVGHAAKGATISTALWNDDLHHSALVALTGRNEAYYTDYRGAPQEFISAAKYGYLFQGQPYLWQEAPRGTPDLRDSTGSVRLLSSKITIRFPTLHPANACAFKLRPGVIGRMTALFFWARGHRCCFKARSSALPARLFISPTSGDNLREAIRKGRFRIPRPISLDRSRGDAEASCPIRLIAEVFARCKLDFSERETNQQLYDLHRDLMRLRREDSRFREQSCRWRRRRCLGRASFVLRYFAKKTTIVCWW